MSEVDLQNVLGMAIQREIEAHAFYTGLAGRVNSAEARETLNFLAAEEKKHREFLESYRDSGLGPEALRQTEPIEYKIAEYMEKPDKEGDLQSQEAYLIAAHRELNAYNFYRELAALHPRGEIRAMLEKMAVEEMKHKEKVEYLYANTAFAQTDGG